MLFSMLAGTSRRLNVTFQFRFSFDFACPRRAVLKRTIFHPICVWKSTGSHVTCRWGACFLPQMKSDRLWSRSLFQIYCELSLCRPGLPSSNQKWCRAQTAQSTHQHYLTGQTVHHSSQHHCGVLDCWDWKGKNQNITIQGFKNHLLLRTLFYRFMF